jgi:DNA-directed RNA polymerase specialized sigma24 family protein
VTAVQPSGPDRMEIEEARTLLRYASAGLTPKQRLAILVFLDHGDTEAARITGSSRQALQRSRKLALDKMRARLEALHIKRFTDVMSFTK